MFTNSLDPCVKPKKDEQNTNDMIAEYEEGTQQPDLTEIIRSLDTPPHS